jgi:hypothetical protein
VEPAGGLEPLTVSRHFCGSFLRGTSPPDRSRVVGFFVAGSFCARCPLYYLGEYLPRTPLRSSVRVI